MNVRSKYIGEASPEEKVMNRGISDAPVIGPPARLRIVPPVRPENDPLSKAAVVIKVGLKVILVALTPTVPAIFAWPVTGVACAIGDMKHAQERGTSIRKSFGNRVPFSDGR
jgi:hypothetical protein